MRSKKDRDTVVVVTTDTRAEMLKVFHDNPNWEIVRKPEIDSILANFDSVMPQNRAERRALRFGKRGIA